MLFFNFCRPNSSLNFIDGHEQDTKQQEKFHKSHFKNYEDSLETRTLGFKKVDWRMWVCLWPAQNIPVCCKCTVSAWYRHRLPDPKPLALKPPEKWILHTLYKDVKDQAETLKKSDEKICFPRKIHINYSLF